MIAIVIMIAHLQNNGKLEIIIKRCYFVWQEEL